MSAASKETVCVTLISEEEAHVGEEEKAYTSHYDDEQLTTSVEPQPNAH